MATVLVAATSIVHKVVGAAGKDIMLMLLLMMMLPMMMMLMAVVVVRGKQWEQDGTRET